MRFSNHKLADSGRFVRRSFLFACLASLLLGSSSKASTVLDFGQINAGDNVTLHNNGAGVSTLSTAGNPSPDGGPLSIAVDITTFMGAPGVNIPAYMTFVGVTSTGPASYNVATNTDSQPFSGTIEFSALPGGPSGPGTNYLTAVFTNALFSPTLSGADLGFLATLGATQPPESLVLTSDFALLGPPTSLSIGFTNLSNALTIASGSLGIVGDTTMQAGGPIAGKIVPEPSTFAIAGLGALGMIGYGLRRRKALGA